MVHAAEEQMKSEARVNPASAVSRTDSRTHHLCWQGDAGVLDAFPAPAQRIGRGAIPLAHGYDCLNSGDRDPVLTDRRGSRENGVHRTPGGNEHGKCQEKAARGV